MVKCPHAASGCDYPASECAGHCASKQQPEALRLADGLDTPDEDGFVTQLDQDAAAELRRLHAENAEQIGEIVALKEQRDELLEALREVLSLYASLIRDIYGSEFVDRAHTAIAKAGGAA